MADLMSYFGFAIIILGRSDYDVSGGGGVDFFLALASGSQTRWIFKDVKGRVTICGAAVSSALRQVMPVGRRRLMAIVVLVDSLLVRSDGFRQPLAGCLS